MYLIVSGRRDKELEALLKKVSPVFIRVIGGTFKTEVTIQLAARIYP